MRLLNAAARLMQQNLAESNRDRLTSAMHWMTKSAISAEAGFASTKALDNRNRWKSEADFLADAIVWAMHGKDLLGPDDDPDIEDGKYWGEQFGSAFVAAAAAGGPASVLDLIIATADGLLAALQADPRSFLLSHLGPLLGGNRTAAAGLRQSASKDQEYWKDAYRLVIETAGLPLRPGWTVDRITLALQAVLDGFLVRSRAQAHDYDTEASRSEEGLTLFADTILAITLSALDIDLSGCSVDQVLRERLTH